MMFLFTDSRGQGEGAAQWHVNDEGRWQEEFHIHPSGRSEEGEEAQPEEKE